MSRSFAKQAFSRTLFTIRKLWQRKQRRKWGEFCEELKYFFSLGKTTQTMCLERLRIVTPLFCMHLLLIQSCQYFDGREAVGATERGWFSHQSRPKGQLTAVLPSHPRRGRRSRALLFISTTECRSVVQISGEISRVGATGRYYCKALQFYQHRYTMHKLLADSI